MHIHFPERMNLSFSINKSVAIMVFFLVADGSKTRFLVS